MVRHEYAATHRRGTTGGPEPTPTRSERGLFEDDETETAPAVSVILPCYNCADTIGAQLSALGQQVAEAPFEIVVADDGSTDDSARVVDSFRSEFGNLKLLRMAHHGDVARVRNAAAAEASGDLLLFCDADDVVGPGWVAAMASALDVCEFVAGPFEFEKLNPRWLVIPDQCPQTDGLQQGDPPFLPFAGGGNLGIRRSIFDEVQGFAEGLPALEDTDLCFRVQLRGYPLHFVSDAVVHVRRRVALASLYRQGYTWGFATVALQHRYRSQGMPRPHWGRHVGGWLLALPRLAVSFYDRTRLARWLFRQGWRAGRLRASFKYRVLAI